MFPKPSEVEGLINATAGPFLEIGGPSQHLDQPPFIDFDQITKPLIVTNTDFVPVQEGLYRHQLTGEREWDASWGDRGKSWKLVAVEQKAGPDGWGELEFFKPELWVDGTDLLYGIGQLGALYTVSFPPEIEPQFFREAARTLEPGGILVVEQTKNIRMLSTDYFSIVRRSFVSARYRHFAARRNDRPYSPAK